MSMMKEGFSLPHNGLFIISKAKVFHKTPSVFYLVNNAICAL